MICRGGALCALIALVVAGGAQAHDSGPAIARAIVALQQGPISYDPASPVSELQADAVNQRLGRSSDIAIAILPVDFSLSAVAAARELELHLDRPGTIVTVLGGDLGATSTDVDGHVLGTLVRDSQAVYNRDGPVPGLVGLIDAIEAAKLPETDADSGRGWAAVLVVVAAVGAASALALFALRRRRLQRNTG